MPSEPKSATQRLHPSALLFGVGSAAKRLLLPGIVVLFASRGGDPTFWMLLLFFPALAAVLIKYWSYRYRFGDDELVIREGIVTRNERHIPYARIQNIDLLQNPLHRWFGVAEVRVETASGDKPEAVIRVLSLEAVAEMRGRVFAGKQETRETPPQAAEREGSAEAPQQMQHGRLLLQLPPRELVLHGLISNRGMVVVAAALGAMWQLDLFERFGLSLSKESWRQFLRAGRPGYLLGFVLLGAIALLVALLLLRLLSVGLAMFKLYGFELRRQGEDLRAEYGLLTRVSKTIPRHRVQLISTREGLLHRWFGRAMVQVETAGGPDDEGASSADHLTLAPLIPKSQVAELLSEVLPEVQLDQVQWRALAPRARLRLLRRSLVRSVILVAVAVAAVGAWGACVAAALFPLAYIRAGLYVKYTAYALTPGAVLYRSGWWVRRLSVARFNRIQVVSLHETPFDRRSRMATLRVDTAGGGRTGHPIAVSLIEAQTAKDLHDFLYREAGQTAFRW